MSRSWSSLRGRMRGYGFAVRVEAALVAGPAEVAHRVGRVGDAVELLPVAAAAVRHPDVVRAGPDREPRPGCGSRARACGARSASALANIGLPGTPSPVSGSIRISEPSSPSGSPLVRRSCARSRPPSAVGGRQHRSRRVAGRVAARVRRVAELAVVPDPPARAVAARHVQVAVGAELEPAAGVELELLAPVVDQHLLGAVDAARPRRAARETRADTRQLTSSRRPGTGRCVCPALPQVGGVPPIGASST